MSVVLTDGTSDPDFFVIKQRLQGLFQVLRHIVRQHADEKVCAHPRFGAMTGRTNPKINAFQRTESLFDPGRVLVTPDHNLRRELLAVLTGAQNVEAIERMFAFDAPKIALEFKAPMRNRAVELLSHFEYVADPADFVCDRLCAQLFFWCLLTSR